MKKLQTSFGAKLTATILLIVFIAICLLCTFGIGFFVSHNYYYDNGRSALNDSYSELGTRKAKEVIYNYYPMVLDYENTGVESLPLEKMKTSFGRDKTNFSFGLFDENEQLLLRNYDSVDYDYTGTYSATLTQNDGTEKKLTVSYFIDSSLSAEDDFYYSNKVNGIISSLKYTVIFIFLAAFVLGITLLVFLIYSVGLRQENGSRTVKFGFIDKIPLDLYIIICLALFFVNLLLMPRLSNSIVSTFCTNYFSALFWSLLILSIIMTLSVRCKAENPLTKTLIYSFFSWMFAPRRNLFDKLRNFLNNLPLLWKTILVLAFLSLIEFVFLALGTRLEIFIFWIIEKVVTVPIILLVIMNLRTLRGGVKQIANGDIDHQIDTKYLMWNFRDYGDDLNNISKAMQSVVDERMKSERFKTELITNVSHDIKTPLTSIVTYVDLLKNPSTTKEQADEYIDVLDRQSSKLAKLINDLVDASKASTGNVPVELACTDCGVMLTQAAAEYDDKFRSAELTLIENEPDRPIYINADGRLLWRVFDNLLSNIVKYSQPQTRVYLSLKESDNKAFVSFSNISKCPLNITSEELMERFVRGDSSRNTEGSGLGLSIAQSLTALQNGSLDISIDGDLFKVTLTFDKADNL